MYQLIELDSQFPDRLQPCEKDPNTLREIVFLSNFPLVDMSFCTPLQGNM